MMLKTLRERREAAPFKPFAIHLAHGRALTVVTPDHLLVPPTSTEFLVGLRDGGVRFVAAAQVVSVGRSGPRVKSR